MACCSGEEDLKTGSDDTKVTSSGDSGSTPVSENNANGDTEDTGNSLVHKIPPADDVPDARPSADPSEVDAKPIG